MANRPGGRQRLGRRRGPVHRAAGDPTRPAGRHTKNFAKLGEKRLAADLRYGTILDARRRRRV